MEAIALNFVFADNLVGAVFEDEPPGGLLRRRTTGNKAQPE
jgi:hypothetical protein